MRRVMLGKSNQTLMPQKWEPSVQMGVVMPARGWQAQAGFECAVC
jgi:hypothetical protein